MPSNTRYTNYMFEIDSPPDPGYLLLCLRKVSTYAGFSICDDGVLRGYLQFKNHRTIPIKRPWWSHPTRWVGCTHKDIIKWIKEGLLKHPPDHEHGLSSVSLPSTDDSVTTPFADGLGTWTFAKALPPTKSIIKDQTPKSVSVLDDDEEGCPLGVDYQYIGGTLEKASEAYDSLGYDGYMELLAALRKMQTDSAAGASPKNTDQ